MAMSAGYVTSQNNRYKQAIQNNDQALMKRLEADAQRAGYALTKPVTPKVQSVATMQKPQTPLQQQASNQLSNAVKLPMTNQNQNAINLNGMPKLLLTNELQDAQNMIKPLDKKGVVQNVLSGAKADNAINQNPNYQQAVANTLKQSPTFFDAYKNASGLNQTELEKQVGILPYTPNPVQVTQPTSTYKTGMAGSESKDVAKMIVNNPAQPTKEGLAIANTITDTINKIVEEQKGLNSNTGNNGSTTGSTTTQSQTNNATNAQNKDTQFTYDPNTDQFLKNLLNQQKYQDKTPMEQFDPGTFNYDVNSDPVYQQALKNAMTQADLSAKRASRNALETMNERGILNSSLTSNQLAEIQNEYQQQANNEIQSNLLPQLLQQAYNRYRDSVSDKQFNLQRSDQQRNQDYQRYLDSLDQAQKNAQLGLQSRNQQFSEFQSGQDQDYRNRQLALTEAGLTGNYNGAKTLEAQLADRDYNLKRGQLMGTIDGQKTMDAMNADRNYLLDQEKQKIAQETLAYEKQRNAKQDTEESKRWWASYQQDGQKLAQQMKLDYAQLNQRQKEFLADEAYREKQLSKEQQKIDWDKDPTNPANIQRNANAEAKQQELKDRNEWLSQQKFEFIKQIDAEELTYDDALKQIDRLEKSGIYQAGEANNVRNVLKGLYYKPEEKPKEKKIPDKSYTQLSTMFN